MLQKSVRLKGSVGFERLSKKGRSKTTPHLSMRYLFVDNLQGPKIGIIVSAKIDKKAVRRNALKRKIRAILRKVLGEIDKNAVFFIQVRGKIVRPMISYAKLEEEILELIRPVIRRV